MPVNSTLSKVSIILPTYNRASYILEAIDSVRNQTYPNWELLIIDDGSKDNTVELVTQIPDERVKLYKTASRLGITGTRNEGLRKVNGDLIAFIDSDDLWAPEKLEKQVAALSEYPDAAFSLTGGYNFRKQAEPVEFFYKQTEGVKYGDLLIPIFKSEVATPTPSLLFRKECLEKIAFFNETKLFADADFIITLARYYKGVVLYESLFYRRLHDSNISSGQWVKGYEEGIRLIHSYKNILPGEVTRNALFKLYINSGEDHLAHNQKTKALRQFLKAWTVRPFSIIPFKKMAKTFLRSSKK